MPTLKAYIVQDDGKTRVVENITRTKSKAIRVALPEDPTVPVYLGGTWDLIFADGTEYRLFEPNQFDHHRAAQQRIAQECDETIRSITFEKIPDA